MHLPIYMDYQATTPMDKRVLEAMMPAMTKSFGNPHSKSHCFGWESEDLVENAREKVAKVINANTKDIIFTSGATESNNLAIKGVANFYKDKKDHIITCATEHKCVLESFRFFEAARCGCIPVCTQQPHVDFYNVAPYFSISSWSHFGEFVENMKQRESEMEYLSKQVKNWHKYFCSPQGLADFMYKRIKNV